MGVHFIIIVPSSTFQSGAVAHRNFCESQHRHPYISVAILRHQLLEINVISKSVLYVLLPASSETVLSRHQQHGTAFHFLSINSVLVSVFVRNCSAHVVSASPKNLQDWINKIFFRYRYYSNLMLQRIVQ
jgi:hypothetical protein